MKARRTIRVVAAREFRERVRSKAFIVSTALLLVLVLGAGIFAGVVGGRAGTRSYDLGLVGVEGPLREALEDLGDRMDREVRVRDLPGVPEAEQALGDDEVDVVVVGDREILVKEERGALGTRLLEEVRTVTRVHRGAAEAGLPSEEAATLLRAEPLPVRAVEPFTLERLGRMGIAAGALFFLFIALASVTGLMLTGVVEEKTSRVGEVVVSAAGVRALLGGKVIGLGALGLFQLTIVLFPAVIPAVLVVSGGLATGLATTVAAAVLWFLLGYLFYGYAIAAVGSLISRPEDMQYSTLPVLGLLFASFYTAIPAAGAPETLFARVLSFFPPTAPGVMLARIGAGGVVWWEVVASVAVMVAAIVLLVRVAERIYAAGVVHVGRRLKLREAWRTAEL